MSITSKAKNKAKQELKKKIRKVAWHITKPFLPFVIIILIVTFAACTIIDSVFVQEVQSDSLSLTQAGRDLKNFCISIVKKLNGSDDKKKEKDKDNRESSKEIQWSQLYAIMAFHNMAYGTEINKELASEVAKDFKSDFKYDTLVTKTETKTKDEEGNEVINVTEEKSTILVESNTIMGHYKYIYQDKVIEDGDKKITTKEFVKEELVGEEYERLKTYLKDKLHVSESDIDIDTQIIIQAATGYSNSKENTQWLLSRGIVDTSAEIVTDGEKRAAKGMFTWPVPGYTKITSPYGGRNHPIYGGYNFHSGTDVGAPMGSNFVAMADGTVIVAAYHNSYGNYVMIDHRKWNCYFICTW